MYGSAVFTGAGQAIQVETTAVVTPPALLAVTAQ
jgi:hypothetical protein